MKNKYVKAIFPYATWLVFALVLARILYKIMPFGAISENVYAYVGLMILYSVWYLAGYNHNSKNILGIVMFVIFISIFYAEPLNPLNHIIQPIFLVGYVIAGALTGTMTEIAVTGESKKVTRNKIGTLKERK